MSQFLQFETVGDEKMKVEPIRDKKLIREIMSALEKDRSPVGERRYLLFASGIYLGRRISDLLELKVGDVRGKKTMTITEGKTGKEKVLAFNSILQKIYKERLAGRDPEEPLFVSRQKTRVSREVQAISRRTALRDIHAIGKMAGIDYRIGTHTLRKTFGYWYYQNYQDIGMLMKLFNHSKEEITQVYIGLDVDEQCDAFRRTSHMYDD